LSILGYACRFLYRFLTRMNVLYETQQSLFYKAILILKQIYF
jgi:hypothetical protein